MHDETADRRSIRSLAVEPEDSLYSNRLRMRANYPSIAPGGRTKLTARINEKGSEPHGRSLSFCALRHLRRYGRPD
ncbi:hypothetical protein, partial [Stutzerimonas nitrititolerans]|uniref:hypothetical protein n=1 Tax=Stutzerimonas nitrititolerans TaxID=2482751 RepID=UPI0028AB94FF